MTVELLGHVGSAVSFIVFRDIYGAYTQTLLAQLRIDTGT